MPVICAICGKSYKLIAFRHLKNHGLTFNEYKILYPEAKLMDDECKNKIRLDHVGTKFTEERCDNISKSLKGRKLSVEHCKLLSKIRKRHKFSDSRNRKLAESLRGIPKTEVHKIRLSISAKKRTRHSGSTESIPHKSIKEFIGTNLQQQGYSVILEKYIQINHNLYAIDVYAHKTNDVLIFEVGRCKQSKLMDLQRSYSRIFHIPYHNMKGGLIV